MSKFGDHYRRVRQFRAPESRTIVITAQSGPNEDFVILRHPDDVLSHNLSKAQPWWLGASIPLLGGIALIVFVVLRKILRKDDLDLSL